MQTALNTHSYHQGVNKPTLNSPKQSHVSCDMEHTHEKALEKFVYSIEYPIKIVIKSIVVARKPRER